MVLLWTILLVLTPGPVLAHADAGLEAVFEIVPVAAGPQASPQARTAPRHLFLLVDYSGSMNDDAEEFGKRPEKRWDALQRRIREQLKVLWEQDPTVRVTIRFFHAGVAPGGRTGLLDDPLPSPRTLDGIKDADFTFPKHPGRANGTALYKGIISTCDAIVNQFKGEQMPDWLALVVVSDGLDANSSDREKRDWNQALDRLRAALPGCATGVIPVGKEAKKMAEDGDYGTLRKCFELPKPPPPRPRFQLRASTAVVSVDRPMADAGGKEQVGIRIKGDLPKGWTFVPTLLEGTTGRLAQSVPVTARDAVGTLTMVSDARDPSAGGAISVRLDAKATADLDEAGPVVVGAPEVQFRFRPAIVPTDPAQWRIVGPSALRIDSTAEFTASIGNAQSIEWTFRGPPGAKAVTARGPSARFDGSIGPGRWTIDLKATSSDGKSRERTGGLSFEVIDSRVKVVGPVASPVGSTARFTAQSIGRSPASLSWFVDGEEQPQARGKDSLEFVPDGVQLYSIVCRAISTVGAFEFDASASVRGEIAPGIICQDRSLTVDCLEIDESALIPLRAFAVRTIQWKVGDQAQRDLPIVYEPGAKPIADLSLEVEVAQLKPLIGNMPAPARIPVSWWGLDEKGTKVGEGSATLVVRQVRFDMGLVSPAAGTELAKGETHALKVRADLAGIEGLDSTALRSRLDGLAATLDFELRDGSGNVIASLAQPPQAIKDGMASIGIALPANFPGDILGLQARLNSQRLVFPTETRMLGSFPIRLRQSNYVIAPVTDARAYSRLKFELEGLGQGESIRWTIRRADGTTIHEWTGDKATDAVDGLAQGLPRGTYSVSASVTRSDGSLQAAPSRDFEVESSVWFQLEDWTWEDGTALPTLEGELRGEPSELQGAVVEWESCSVTGTGSEPLQCRVVPIQGTQRYRIELPGYACGSVPTVKVRGNVRWPSAPELPIEGTAPLKLKATTDVAAPPSLTVGGKVGSAHGGGVVAAPFPGIRGPHCEGSVEMHLTYEPDKGGTERRAFVQRIVNGAAQPGWVDLASGATVPNIQASAVDTGTWSLLIKLQRPDESSSKPVGQVLSFTQTKEPDWIRAGMVLVAGMAAAMLVVKLARGNKVLWISVKPLMTPQCARVPSGRIRPTIWPWSRRRPWFNLWNKSASMPLVKDRGGRGLINLSSIKSDPGRRWLLDNGQCRTEVTWSEGALRLKDRDREWDGSESQNVVEYPPCLYPGNDLGTDSLKSLQLLVIRPRAAAENAESATAYAIALLTLTCAVFVATEWL